MNEKPTESTDQVTIISLIAEIEKANRWALENAQTTLGLLTGFVPETTTTMHNGSMMGDLVALRDMAKDLVHLTQRINKAIGGEDEEV